MFSQGSTWRGLALLGSSVAMLATGDGHIFNATINETGLHLGGIVGNAINTLVPVAIGAYELMKDEFKNGE